MTKRNDISVPQGYFQDLEKRLGQIPREKARVTTFQKVSLSELLPFGFGPSYMAEKVTD